MITNLALLVVSKGVPISLVIKAYHDIHSPTRRQLIHEGSNIPSMGWTVVSQITMVNLFSIYVTCGFKRLGSEFNNGCHS
jgi:hypothetical protein